LLFALIFIISGVGHFSSGSIGHAASSGVPAAHILVPLSGIIALLGGLMIVLGFKARIGAWLIVLFLVPVTLMMHPFWAFDDAQQAMMHRVNFLKNLALIGGALFIAYWGAGPISVDERRTHAHPGRVREPLPT
jgi:putative oxidoreductase